MIERKMNFWSFKLNKSINFLWICPTAQPIHSPVKILATLNSRDFSELNQQSLRSTLKRWKLFNPMWSCVQFHCYSILKTLRWKIIVFNFFILFLIILQFKDSGGDSRGQENRLHLDQNSRKKIGCDNTCIHTRQIASVFIFVPSVNPL